MQLQLSQNAFCRTADAPDQAPVTLYDLYMSTFEAVLCDTDALREECFRLRYQVYCLEHTGYEDPSAFPDGLERDAYDPHSLHALLRHRATDTFIGTVRLILHPDTSTTGVFPVHQLCAAHGLELPQPVPLSRVCEISRFCISKKSRPRVLHSLAEVNGSAADRARVIPAMSLGLIRAICQMSKQNGLRQWCMEMEPRIIEMLATLGIHFASVGPLIEFHGKRRICHNLVDALIARMGRERPDVWEVVTDQGRFCALNGAPPTDRKAAGKTRRLKATA